MNSYEKLLEEIDDPRESGIRNELLGPKACGSPLELREVLPLKKKYLGPGVWYRFIGKTNQEDRDEKYRNSNR